MDKNRIYIFDTTLRDGEQCPGASLSMQEKIEIAKQLEKLNVDIIEAGFPISSPTQFESVQRIANEVNVIVAGLARTKEEDIKAAYEALKDGKKIRIHTFIGTSDIHILGKFGDDRYGKSLKEKRKTVLKMTQDSVAYAKSFVKDVEYSAEDAGRTDMEYLVEVIEAAIEAGALTINIPDTTGYTFPSEFGAKIAELRKRVKNIDKAVISVHCHNDLGLAVANSLSGVQNGARQVECTINGIGERAGNASLEEVVMALKVRKDLFKFFTKINTEEIYNSSRMVSSYTGLVVQPNKAIVGDNAFAHESGIHQDGMLKDRQTYEIMLPESVGVPKTKIVLGRHSGKHGLKVRLSELGYHINEKDMQNIYDKFVALADKKKEVFDDDLRILMEESSIDITKSLFELDYLHVNSGTNSIPTATVRIKTGKESIQESATGDGTVDATFNAIERALKIKASIESYQVRSVTSGRQALGEVVVKIKHNGLIFTGRGVSTDIIEASAKGFIQALSYQEQYIKSKEELGTKYLSDVSQAV
jgi:2-isopropylmalate synthase